MSGETDQEQLVEGDEDVGHRVPPIKWFACISIFFVGVISLVTAICVSYSLAPEIHNVTTVMPAPGITIECPMCPVSPIMILYLFLKC